MEIVYLDIVVPSTLRTPNGDKINCYIIPLNQFYHSINLQGPVRANVPGWGLQRTISFFGTLRSSSNINFKFQECTHFSFFALWERPQMTAIVREEG